MTRRSKKKSPPRRPAPAPAPAQSPVPSVVTDGKADKLLSKVERSLERGATARAVELLDGVWPSGGQGPSSERLTWLFRRWPDRAVVELGSLEGERRDAFLSDALPEVVLRLPEATWASIAALDSPVVAEATVVRQASEAIAAGRDDEAMEHLRKIGLRSPFREARLFLRGLAAFYTGAAEELRKNLRPLASAGSYQRAAAELLAMVDPTIVDRPAMPAAISTNHPFMLPTLLRQLQGQLKRGQYNVALRTAGLAAASDPVRQVALSRALAATLTSTPTLDFDTAIERVSRAMGWSPDGADTLHLTAICVDAALSSANAIPDWRRLIKEIRAGHVSFGVAAKVAQTAVLGRVATIYMVLARGDDEHEQMDYPFRRSSRYRSSQWNKAVETLQQAIQLGPAPFEIWELYLDALEGLGDQAERGRVLERMTATFSDRPRVWREAASAADARGSLHLALRHIEHAIALEPMGRDLRDIESTIRLKIARKYVYEGKAPKAAEAYALALAVPNRTRDATLKARAEASAFEDLIGQPAVCATRREQALAADPRPWLFAAYVVVAREHLIGRGLGRKKGLPIKRGTLGDVTANILTEPDADELEEVFKLASAFDAEFDYDTYGSDDFAPDTLMLPVVVAAANAGGHRLTRLPSLLVALQLAKDDETTLRIAEVALVVAPDDLDVIRERYRAAMALSRPIAYFEGALAILDGAIARGVELTKERASESGRLYLFFGPPPEPPWLIQLRDLRADIAALLAGPAPAPATPEPEAPKKTKGKPKRR